MRILISDFAGHPFPFDLSRRLAEDGHTVEHVYFSANTTPKGAAEVRPGDPPGLAIRALSIGREFKKHSVFSRKFADAAYGKAVAGRLREFRPDIVLSSNMPLDGQQILLRAAREHDAKFIFWLQDLLSTGIGFVLRAKKVPFAGAAAGFYARKERKLLLASDSIVCIAPAFLDKLRDWRIPGAKTVVIENWASPHEVRPLERNNAWAREQGLRGKFRFLYSGTLGMKHKPELLLELARRCAGNPDIAVVVVAGGAGADWLRAQAGNQLPGLKILPFQPYERVSEVFAAADVLLGLLNPDCGEFAVPSKILAYLCARRSILMAAPACNLAAQTILRAEAGEVVSPEPPPAFVDAALRMYLDEAARNRYAANARAYAERTFRIDTITGQFMEIFKSLIESPAGVCRS